MRYLESPSTDPAFNLALEQVVFDRLPRSDGYFMLWQNDNAVIVGRHQNTAAEVNAAYVAEHGVTVVRRLSGGGAVYHDLGNLNFTFVVDAAQGPGVDLSLFCAPVARALSKLGVAAEVSGRNDLTVDGRKFSGNAQYVREGRVMHHGTILFDSDLSVVSQVLNPAADKLSAKGVASVRSRVTNLRPYLPGVTLPDFKAALVEALFQDTHMVPWAFTEEDLAAAEAWKRARYAAWDWNYGASPPCTLRKRRRIEGCGAVEALLTLEGGRIAGLAFQGDWFGAEDLSGLTAPLLGLPLDRAALDAALDGVDVNAYLTGLTGRELAALLSE